MLIFSTMYKSFKQNLQPFYPSGSWSPSCIIVPLIQNCNKGCPSTICHMHCSFFCENIHLGLSPVSHHDCNTPTSSSPLPGVTAIQYLLNFPIRKCELMVVFVYLCFEGFLLEFRYTGKVFSVLCTMICAL